MLAADIGQIYVVGYRSDQVIVRMNDMTGAGVTPLGTRGGGVNEFSQPAGIFVDEAGRIYVADSLNGRIVRMNDMTGAGWTTLGGPGSGVSSSVPSALLWTGQAEST